VGYANNRTNLILSGGGIKGIAFVGALEIAEKKGYTWLNIGGVSAGSLIAAYTGSGYRTQELKKLVYEFDFKNIKMSDLPKRVPVIANYMEFSNSYRMNDQRGIELFLKEQMIYNQYRVKHDEDEFVGYRGNMLKNIIALSNDRCFYDGDYLEEWVHSMLLRKGVRTFADLRGGIIDKSNPNGYKVRMTAVDANRGKIIVLPDDIAFYNVEPDKLEVSKAVRMSTSVPFAFKPVALFKKEKNLMKKYNILDGGVFDNFPVWLIDSSKNIPLVGFRFDDGSKNKLFSIDTPLNILKAILSAMHDIGIPKHTHDVDYIVNINTSKVSFLDFNLSDDDKNYLYEEGKKSATLIYGNIS
jgi:NTE family protein